MFRVSSFTFFVLQVSCDICRLEMKGFARGNWALEIYCFYPQAVNCFFRRMVAWVMLRNCSGMLLQSCFEMLCALVVIFNFRLYFLFLFFVCDRVLI